MNDWFEWNNVRCTDLGIHVTELPDIVVPAERCAFVEVPGRSGSLTLLEGDEVYDDLTLSATCFIADVSRVDEIIAWLRGAGTVTFANRRGGFYYARIVNQIPIARILRGDPACSFAVTFRCQPYFYRAGVETITMWAPGSLTNPCAFSAYPVITVYGSGTRETLMVGGYSVLIDGLSGHITIDCEGMSAQVDGVGASSMVTLMDDAWPVLMPGVNMVNWTGGIERVEIEPRWRSL